MYNGIGLQTARGSCTNSYVQRNLAVIYNKDEFKNTSDFSAPSLRKANNEILEHDKKPGLELKCLEYQQALEEQKLSEDEIEDKVSAYQTTLLNDYVSNLKQKYRTIAKDTHEIAEAQIRENEKARSAFGISESFVDGSSFDRERKAREAAEKEIRGKSYSILHSSSENENEPQTEEIEKQTKKSSSPSDKSSKKRKHSSSDETENDESQAHKNKHRYYSYEGESEGTSHSKKNTFNEGEGRTSYRGERDTSQDKMRGREMRKNRHNDRRSEEKNELRKHCKSKSIERKKKYESDSRERRHHRSMSGENSPASKIRAKIRAKVEAIEEKLKNSVDAKIRAKVEASEEKIKNSVDNDRSPKFILSKYGHDIFFDVSDDEDNDFDEYGLLRHHLMPAEKLLVAKLCAKLEAIKEKIKNGDDNDRSPKYTLSKHGGIAFYVSDDEHIDSQSGSTQKTSVDKINKKYKYSNTIKNNSKSHDHRRQRDSSSRDDSDELPKEKKSNRRDEHRDSNITNSKEQQRARIEELGDIQTDEMDLLPLPQSINSVSKIELPKENNSGESDYRKIAQDDSFDDDNLFSDKVVKKEHLDKNVEEMRKRIVKRREEMLVNTAEEPKMKRTTVSPVNFGITKKQNTFNEVEKTVTDDIPMQTEKIYELIAQAIAKTQTAPEADRMQTLMSLKHFLANVKFEKSSSESSSGNESDSAYSASSTTSQTTSDSNLQLVKVRPTIHILEFN